MENEKGSDKSNVKANVLPDGMVEAGEGLGGEIVDVKKNPLSNAEREIGTKQQERFEKYEKQNPKEGIIPLSEKDIQTAGIGGGGIGNDGTHFGKDGKVVLPGPND